MGSKTSKNQVNLKRIRVNAEHYDSDEELVQHLVSFKVLLCNNPTGPLVKNA